MTLRYRTKDPLADIDRSQQEEIAKYKWIESEKQGRDIGWEQARLEWLQKHFPAWKSSHWSNALTEALRAATGLN